MNGKHHAGFLVSGTLLVAVLSAATGCLSRERVVYTDTVKKYIPAKAEQKKPVIEILVFPGAGHPAITAQLTTQTTSARVVEQEVKVYQTTRRLFPPAFLLLAPVACPIRYLTLGYVDLFREKVISTRPAPRDTASTPQVEWYPISGQEVQFQVKSRSSWDIPDRRDTDKNGVVQFPLENIVRDRARKKEGLQWRLVILVNNKETATDLQELTKEEIAAMDDSLPGISVRGEGR